MPRGKRVGVHILLGIIGGGLYVLIELLWRRRSHISMFFVGGICFTLIGSIHTRFNKLVLPLRCAICAIAVTAVEFVSGCLLNRCWHMNVWDYSDCRYNIMGQVCLLYTVFWGLLSAVAQPVYSLCRRTVERRLSPCKSKQS